MTEARILYINGRTETLTFRSKRHAELAAFDVMEAGNVKARAASDTGEMVRTIRYAKV
jgi:hypothetical protein